MVNNSLRGGTKVLPLSFFVFLFLSSPLFSQKIDKHYTSSVQEGYYLYYFLPSKEMKATSCDCRLQYDITVMSSKDSATFNFSISSPTVIGISAIKMGSSEDFFEAKKLYIDKKSKTWKMRYSTMVPIKELERYFSSEISTLKVRTENSNLDFSQKARNWKKYSEINTQILQLIRLNMD
jgi:hypothetical protein